MRKETEFSQGMDDDTLVTRAVKGDANAYRVLVERYQQRVHSVAMGVLGHFEDALDVTQETFIKAHRNLKSFRRQSSFYTWLYRIAFNMAIDERRKRFRHIERAVGDTAEMDRTIESSGVTGERLLSKTRRPDEALGDKELRGYLMQALETLTPEHRAVIILREVDGLSYAEISEVVSCSKGTVMSRLHHARKRMKQAILDISEEAGEVLTELRKKNV